MGKSWEYRPLWPKDQVPSLENEEEIDKAWLKDAKLTKAVKRWPICS